MQISIEKLRRWLLFAALALAVVIAGYLGVARYRRWRAPGESVQPLPTGIQQQTNGFTYSKSNQGRTLFTIHAARAVQLQQSGQAELFDVLIILYGRVPGREDRIAGHEFHYDQNTGVATAKGEVHLDLQAPAVQPGSAPGDEDVDPAAMSGKGADKGIIHVKTQGIVFVQNLQVAATDQPLEFAFNGIVGHATGAEFDSDRGLITLQSAVDARVLLHGKTVNITASHAVLDHVSGESNLTHVVAQTDGQTGHAENVTIHSRKDGSIDHIDANGNVAMSSDNYGDITAPVVHLWMDAKSQPLRASASGGLHYDDKQAGLLRTGEASDGDATFGDKGTLRQVHLNGNVKMHERASAETAGKATPVMLERDLAAAHLTLGFVPGANAKSAGKKSRSVLQSVHAEGAARFSMQQPQVLKNNVSGIATREISGDVLDGDLSDNHGKRYFSHIQGSGHTRLVQTAADNSVDTSTGDAVNIQLRPQTVAASRKPQPHASQQMEITSAVQTGHVQISQVSSAGPPKPGEKPALPSNTTGQAERAEYTGANQHLVLTGMPQVTDAGTTLWAQRITLDQPTGNVLAEGSVKANYFQQDPDPGRTSDPVHVIADHAQLLHGQQRAIFYGRAGADARMWQQSSQVSAPVLDLVHATQTLTARGDGAAAMPVHAAFPANSVSNSGQPGGSSGGVARVASHQMVYSGITHTAVFTNGVDFASADTRTRSRKATVWFQNAQPGAAKPAVQQPGLMGGSVQRVLAEGSVVIDQPGRHGTGEALLYTTQDGHYLLTGTPAAPPKLVDDVKGTITGASLLFESNDDTVIVSGASGYNRPHIDTQTRSR